MILITGGNGKLGKELIKVFPLGVLSPKRSELDITEKESVFNFIETHKPNTIIHCAALTSVRQCEIDKELAFKINVEGTQNLVVAGLNFNPNCYFVYMSTACVFHGDRGDYIETDVPYPKNFYSLTKLLGEFVTKKLQNYLIIRTNFVERAKWPYEKAFTDRFGTYLFADDLAPAIKDVVDKKMTGVVHIVGEEKLSMFDLAKITTPSVKPMTMDEADLPLTKDMSLRSIRIKPYKLTR